MFIARILILLTSILVLVVSFNLFRQAAGSISLRKLNTVSYVFYYQILVSAFIGSVMVAMGMVDYHYLIQPLSMANKILGWLAVLYSMIIMPVSMILLNRLMGVSSVRDFNNYINRDMINPLGPQLQFTILLAMIIISSLTLIYVLMSNEYVPLFELLKGNVEKAAKGRILVRREFGGIEYIKNLAGYYLMPIFSYYSFLIWRKRRSPFTFLSFLVLTFNSVLLLTYDTQKAPIAYFIVGFLVLWVIYRGSIRKRTLYLAIGAAVVFIVIGYALTGGRGIEQLLDIKSGFYNRLFITSYAGVPLSFELFHDVITDPTWQIGIPSFILEKLNLPTTESARLLTEYMNPEGVREGTANLISSYFLAEAWANYGIIGVLISPMIVGIVIQFLHIFLLKVEKTAMVMSFYSLMTIKWLVIAGFVNFLYLKILFYPVVLFCLLILIKSIIEKWGRKEI